IAPAALVVGVPFTPDPNLETALSSPNIRELEGLPLRRRLEQELELPVLLERDINLLALGEWSEGAARGAAATFAMFVGTGVGACYLEDGRPFRGATGSAVELGHVPIRGEGRRCVCGNTDCLEAYACGHVLNDLAARYARPVARLFADAEQAPDALRDDLRHFVRDLAFALATAVNLFQPEVALVGGGVPNMDGFPRGRFAEIFYAHLRKPVPSETVRLAWAELGSHAALHGASLRAAVLERT
ncbi:MAG: ROK family protein, partial [Deinococcus-Thermus bacterium]|nr:ROK family protein [Deinococcota bacterium]